MGSTRMFLVSSVLCAACVQREVEAPLISLGDAPMSSTSAGKDSSPEPTDEPEPEETETTGATSPEDPPETDGADASASDAETEEPGDASTSGDNEDSADETTEGTPAIPEGDPMWWHCSEDGDCESGVCVVVQVGGTPADGFCSGLCDDPSSDCDSPGSGTAQPICVAASVTVCGLDCTPPATCPDGMSCIMINESPVPVCV